MKFFSNHILCYAFCYIVIINKYNTAYILVLALSLPWPAAQQDEIYWLIWFQNCNKIGNKPSNKRIKLDFLKKIITSIENTLQKVSS